MSGDAGQGTATASSSDPMFLIAVGSASPGLAGGIPGSVRCGTASMGTSAAQHGSMCIGLMASCFCSITAPAAHGEESTQKAFEKQQSCHQSNDKKSQEVPTEGRCAFTLAHNVPQPPPLLLSRRRCPPPWGMRWHGTRNGSWLGWGWRLGDGEKRDGVNGENGPGIHSTCSGAACFSPRRGLVFYP